MDDDDLSASLRVGQCRAARVPLETGTAVTDEP